MKGRIILRKQEADEDSMLEELCKDLGIVSGRDTDKTIVRVFKVVIQQRTVGGTDVEKAAGMNRITAIHHLNKLQDVGIVEKKDNKYLLRGSDLPGLITALQKQQMQHFQRMRKMIEVMEKDFYE
ncbi:MAG: hypothetical protein ABH803_01940 [Candidatus Micrarchaeota archaeon]